MTILRVPRHGAADDVVTVRAWLVPDGAAVAAETEVVEVSTSKATLVVDAGRAGVIQRSCAVGDRLPVGAVLAVIGSSAGLAVDPRAVGAGLMDQPVTGGLIAPVPQVWSRAAEALAAEHGIAATAFAGLAVVRRADVERVIGSVGRGARVDGALEPDGAAVDQASHAAAPRGVVGPFGPEYLGALRRHMRARHRRHVPTGTLLNDRWRLAADLGFGSGTSVYDECLILGDVVVGANCWVGPFTVLDGSKGTLRIGDHTQVGAGSHLYTHQSIEQCLTGGRAPMAGADTTIGRCCFIAPLSVIAPGTVLGDHSFVAAGSYVDGHFPPFSYLAGTPARRVGRVELEGARARLVRDGV